MFSIENHNGRLVEIVLASPVTPEEAGPWADLHDVVVNRIAGGYVCFVDLRLATVFPPDAVDAFVSTMREEPRLVRTGTLLSPSAVLHLQIQRMIREANNPQRRAFREAAELRQYLAEVLSSTELQRLDELLAA